MSINRSEIICKDLDLLDGTVWVEELEHGTHKIGNVLLKDDETLKLQGIKPRWCKVFKKHPSVTFLNEGDWIFVKHGYWSRSVKFEMNGEIKELWCLPKKSVDSAILLKKAK